ncbi:MAG: hypothetical protein U1B80_09795 [Anaerolineaceae bacterium]|nr:hypothetical protein [Anaerolineaceae bacterium]
MSNFDDNLFEEMPAEDVSEPSPRRPRNRAFVLTVLLLGLIFLLALVALGAYAALVLPQRNVARLEQAALINARNTATVMAATNQAGTQIALLIPSATPLPTETPLPTPTSVVVFATATATPEPEAILAAENLARTQTVAALLTQAAPRTPVPTALPSAGFVDDLGIPGLVGVSMLLLSIIFMVRRMRLSATR